VGRFLPINQPNPLATDDMHERISHGTKATSQITRELLGAERGDRLQNPVVRPAVVLVEQLNVIFSHGGEWLTLSSTESYLASPIQQILSGVQGEREELKRKSALTPVFQKGSPAAPAI
jgi:hypothetical protein